MGEERLEEEQIKLSPANLILSKSSGCKTTVDATPPLMPATRCSYLADLTVVTKVCARRRGANAVRSPPSPDMMAGGEDADGGSG